MCSEPTADRGLECPGSSRSRGSLELPAMAAADRLEDYGIGRRRVIGMMLRKAVRVMPTVKNSAMGCRMHGRSIRRLGRHSRGLRRSRRQRLETQRRQPKHAHRQQPTRVHEVDAAFASVGWSVGHGSVFCRNRWHRREGGSARRRGGGLRAQSAVQIQQRTAAGERRRFAGIQLLGLEKRQRLAPAGLWLSRETSWRIFSDRATGNRRENKTGLAPKPQTWPGSSAAGRSAD